MQHFDFAGNKPISAKRYKIYLRVIIRPIPAVFAGITFSNLRYYSTTLLSLLILNLLNKGYITIEISRVLRVFAGIFSGSLR